MPLWFGNILLVCVFCALTLLPSALAGGNYSRLYSRNMRTYVSSRLRIPISTLRNVTSVIRRKSSFRRERRFVGSLASRAVSRAGPRAASVGHWLAGVRQNMRVRIPSNSVYRQTQVQTVYKLNREINEHDMVCLCCSLLLLCLCL